MTVLAVLVRVALAAPRRSRRPTGPASALTYFFLESDDFATEYEYRVLLAGGDGDHISIEYSDSLVGVVLGERFRGRSPEP
jgi:hypothetical protein